MEAYRRTNTRSVSNYENTHREGVSFSPYTFIILYLFEVTYPQVFYLYSSAEMLFVCFVEVKV